LERKRNETKGEREREREREEGERKIVNTGMKDQSWREIKEKER
jgi:hypothetical protein